VLEAPRGAIVEHYPRGSSLNMPTAVRLPAGGFRAPLVSVALAVLTIACVPHAFAQSPRTAAPQSGAAPSESTRASSKVDKAAATSAQAMAKYRASLEPVQAMYERELARQTELAEIRQELYERGALSATDVQQGRRTLAKAQKDVDDIRRQRVEVDRMMVEMRMIEVGKQRPLGRGGFEETPGLVRFNGTASWSLAEDTPKLQRFFQTRFGRPMPISAFGQSPLHDQMGFDHRNALDVAVDPSSSDGRAFMEYLRTSGIPFIAAWGAIPGAASGAHVHVGQPSPRLVGRR
jgi:hypothetical protein